MQCIYNTFGSKLSNKNSFFFAYLYIEPIITSKQSSFLCLETNLLTPKSTINKSIINGNEFHKMTKDNGFRFVFVHENIYICYWQIQCN